jgi:hypothetical protein
LKQLAFSKFSTPLITPLCQSGGIQKLKNFPYPFAKVGILEGLRIVNFLLTNIHKYSQRIYMVKNIFLTKNQ